MAGPDYPVYQSCETIFYLMSLNGLPFSSTYTSFIFLVCQNLPTDLNPRLVQQYNPCCPEGVIRTVCWPSSCSKVDQGSESLEVTYIQRIVLVDWYGLVLRHRLVWWLVIFGIRPQSSSLHFTSRNNLCRVYHNSQKWLCKPLIKYLSWNINAYDNQHS